MVPAILLTLAGLAAGSLAMWPMFGPASAKISAAFLGAALAAYLWVHAGVRNRVRLAAVVVAAIVGDATMAVVGIVALALTWMLTNGGTLTPFVAAAAAGAAGAAVIAVVFLLVLPPKGDHLLLEVVFCATAGASSVLLWVFVARFAAMTTAGAIAQMPLWHVAVASSLAVVASLRLRPVAKDPFVLRCLAGVGVAGVCAMLVASGSAPRAAPATSRRIVVPSPYADAIRAAKIKSVKDAPPSMDLRLITPGAEEKMFARPMAGIGCYPPLKQSIPPDEKHVETLLLQVPARHRYYLQCYRLEDGPNGARVNVLIVRYPNDAWAQYKLRHQGGYDRLFEQRYAGRTTKHGRPIFVTGGKTYWVSGDKILSIGGSAPGETVSAFVDAYLRRYPNSLEPDFDLPYLPRME